MNSMKKICISLIIFILFFLNACKGGVKCGPGINALDDADSDCIVDESDNCPLVYNPAQVDVDEDGAGSSCDQDDTNELVGPSYSVSERMLSSELMANTIPELDSLEYPIPDSLHFSAEKTLDEDQCTYYLLGCDNQFLGIINNTPSDDFSIANADGDFGSFVSPVSIFDNFSFYGRESTSCSAFNVEAEFPPAIYCYDSSTNELEAIGYLTLNSFIPNAINTCDVLKRLSLGHESCE